MKASTQILPSDPQSAGSLQLNDGEVQTAQTAIRIKVSKQPVADKAESSVDLCAADHNQSQVGVFDFVGIAG